MTIDNESSLGGETVLFELANLQSHNYNSSTDRLNNDESRKVTRRKKFTSRKSSSGADTSASDNSDSEVKRQELIIVSKDHDWARTASSRSRNKYRGLTPTTNGDRSRPLSSSEFKDDELGQISRAKSLVDDMSPFKPTDSNLKTLSVEHRMANMSQMSISSQISKNNSVRQRSSETPHNPHSTTPTPRESIVFNRGDDKPFAKILLQSKSLTEPTVAINGIRRSSSSSTGSTGHTEKFPASNHERPLNNESLIQTKLDEFAKNSVKKNESYNQAIDSYERANNFLSEIEKKMDKEKESAEENSERVNVQSNETSFELKDDKKLLGSQDGELLKAKLEADMELSPSSSRNVRRVNRKKNGALIANSPGQTTKSLVKAQSLPPNRSCSRCCVII